MRDEELKSFLAKWCDPIENRRLWNEEKLNKLRTEFYEELDELFI